MPTPGKKPVHEAIDDVKQDIDFIAKSQTNAAQGFSFRGVDDVMQVVGPLLRKHHVGHDVAEIKKIEREWYKTARGTDMTNVTVTVRWCWTGPDGSTKFTESVGEAADTGDKAVAKAQSVAERIELIRTLNIPVAPTRDPDADSHRRAEEPATGTTIPPMPAPRAPRRDQQLSAPSGRDWNAEAIELVNRGLAVVGTNLPEAKSIIQLVIALYKEADGWGELTPTLNRAITGHGKALREQIEMAERKRRQSSRSTNPQAAAAAEKVTRSRRSAPPSP